MEEKRIKQVIWTDPAAQDLEELYAYLEIFSSKKAQKTIDKLFEKVENLFDFPEMGAIEHWVSQPTKEYRYLVEGNYKIIYLVLNDIVSIERVFDTRQDPNRLQ